MLQSLLTASSTPETAARHTLLTASGPHASSVAEQPVHQRPVAAQPSAQQLRSTWTDKLVSRISGEAATQLDKVGAEMAAIKERQACKDGSPNQCTPPFDCTNLTDENRHKLEEILTQLQDYDQLDDADIDQQAENIELQRAENIELQKALSELAYENQLLRHSFQRTSESISVAAVAVAACVARELSNAETQTQQHAFECEYLADQLEATLGANLTLEQEAAMKEQEGQLSLLLDEAVLREAALREQQQQQSWEAAAIQQQQSAQIESLTIQLDATSADRMRLEKECAVLAQFARAAGVDKEDAGHAQQQLESLAEQVQQLSTSNQKLQDQLAGREADRLLESCELSQTANQSINQLSQQHQLEEAQHQHAMDLQDLTRQLEQMGADRSRLERDCAVWVQTAQAMEAEKERLQEQLQQQETQSASLMKQLDETSSDKVRLQHECSVLRERLRVADLVEQQLAQYQDDEKDWRQHCRQMEMELDALSPPKLRSEHAAHQEETSEERGRRAALEQRGRRWIEQQLLQQSGPLKPAGVLSLSIAESRSEEQAQAHVAAERARLLDEEIKAVKKRLQAEETALSLQQTHPALSTDHQNTPEQPNASM